MGQWQPDKAARANPDVHLPTPTEVDASIAGLQAARALLEEKEVVLATAKIAMDDLHARLARGDGVSRADKLAVNDAFRQADHDVEHAAAWVRTLERASRGLEIGAHQTMGGGAQ